MARSRAHGTTEAQRKADRERQRRYRDRKRQDSDALAAEAEGHRARAEDPDVRPPGWCKNGHAPRHRRDDGRCSKCRTEAQARWRQKRTGL